MSDSEPYVNEQLEVAFAISDKNTAPDEIEPVNVEDLPHPT